MLTRVFGACAARFPEFEPPADEPRPTTPTSDDVEQPRDPGGGLPVIHEAGGGGCEISGLNLITHLDAHDSERLHSLTQPDGATQIDIYIYTHTPLAKYTPR